MARISDLLPDDSEGSEGSPEVAGPEEAAGLTAMEPELLDQLKNEHFYELRVELENRLRENPQDPTARAALWLVTRGEAELPQVPEGVSPETSEEMARRAAAILPGRWDLMIALAERLHHGGELAAAQVLLREVEALPSAPESAREKARSLAGELQGELPAGPWHADPAKARDVPPPTAWEQFLRVVGVVGAVVLLVLAGRWAAADRLVREGEVDFARAVMVLQHNRETTPTVARPVNPWETAPIPTELPHREIREADEMFRFALQINPELFRALWLRDRLLTLRLSLEADHETRRGLTEVREQVRARLEELDPAGVLGRNEKLRFESNLRALRDGSGDSL